MKSRMLILSVIVMMSVSPVWAQESATHRVTFDGFSFSFDSALAANVNIVPVPGDPLDYEAPGGPQAPYTGFILYDAMPSPENWFDAVGGVRVYRVAEMAGYTEFENRLKALQDLLAQRPDLTAYMDVAQNMNDVMLPFLPVLPAAQVLRARAEYVATGSVSGVRFVTVYAQAADPFLADTFFYTFQGLSADGSVYVSALFWLNASIFPENVPADMDWEAFGANYMTYLAESVAKLNGASPDQFTPSLEALDGIVESFAFDA
jgi:hypothetical protein